MNRCARAAPADQERVRESEKKCGAGENCQVASGKKNEDAGEERKKERCDSGWSCQAVSGRKRSELV